MTATLARPILRDPAFGRLCFIQASTQIGGNMSLYALTILVFATTRSNAAVSALVMSFLLPTILLSAVAGVLVDRLDVRWASVLASIVSAASLVPILVAGPLADEISGATVIAMAAIGVQIVAGWSAALFGQRATAV